ncbi:MAG: hypothetical protein ACRDNM_00745 [Gaiellaceae bacterium]
MKRSLLMIVLVLIVVAQSAAASTAAVSPARVVAQMKTEWISEMRASAKNGDRAARFPSPPRGVLMGRLRKAEKLYGFRVVSVQLLHPLQSAPVVVIRSDREQSIARATPKIILLFDPYHPTEPDPIGYAYEGYFLVAETRRGVPYLATFNRGRAPHIGGGEWAASENLYPFAHG